MKLKIKSKSKSKEKYDLTDIVREIRVVDIDSVKPYDKNPRKNKQAIDKLADVIKLHGQRTPIVVWSKDRQIYKGNTTWFAMKKAGFKKIAIALTDFPNKKKAISYALVDNKSGEWSEWDDALLAELLQSEEFEGLKTSEIGRLTGFADKDLKGLLLSSSELPELLPDVNLEGGMPDKADYMVIQFEGREEAKTFKEKLGFKTKHPRVIPYKDLLTVMEWKEKSDLKKVKIKLKRR